MPGGAAFVEGLRAMIDAGRAFGRHPLWRRIAEGRLPRSALRPFAVQFFLQVREFPRDAMEGGAPLPATAALIDWFLRSTREHPFIEGAAATNLAAEGQVPGAFGPFARALEQHYGCTRAQVAFWDVHEQADREHSAIGDHIVVRLATTPELQADVRRAVARSLELWWRFFDGTASAIEDSAAGAI